MRLLRSFFITLMLLLVPFCNVCKALDCQLNGSNKHKVAHTIVVDKSGHGHFTTIQSAIDSIPAGNKRWIRIKIFPGKYMEKVKIDVNRPCIFLEGAGYKQTSIEWGDHQSTDTSATFASFADSIVAKGITFKNTYNLQKSSGNIKFLQAVAARVSGDKSAFYKCAFVGIQDTFWDEKGRHYINKCYFEGAVDFIFGSAKSIYKGCEISVNIGKYAPSLNGFITAQKKDFPSQASGFVFKQCVITGTGKAYLGRAWGAYSTVIFEGSRMSEVVVPEGWNAWNFVKHEANFTYAEANNGGPGSDMSKRMPWVKKFRASQLKKFLDMSFIDEDRWLEKLPVT